MALRTFTDRAGVEWQVWETVPQGSYEERTFATNARLLSEVERRTTDDRPARARRPLTQGLENGWLTFTAGDEKRRLSPIPPGWADATDEELARYCESARVIRPR